MMLGRPTTTSTATNTKARKIRTKTEEGKLSPTEAQSIEEQHEKSISELNEDTDDPEVVSKAESMQKSTSATSNEVKQSKSFAETVLELANYALTMAIFIKDVLTSNKYRNIAVKTIQAIHSMLHSSYAQFVAESIVDIAGKFATLTTYIHETNGTTKVSLEILPAVETN